MRKTMFVAIAALAFAMTAPPALCAPAAGMQIANERTAPSPLVDQAAHAVQAISRQGVDGGKLYAIVEACASASVAGRPPLACSSPMGRVDRESIAFHLLL